MSWFLQLFLPTRRKIHLAAIGRLSDFSISKETSQREIERRGRDPGGVRAINSIIFRGKGHRRAALLFRGNCPLGYRAWTVTFAWRKVSLTLSVDKRITRYIPSPYNAAFLQWASAPVTKAVQFLIETFIRREQNVRIRKLKSVTAIYTSPLYPSHNAVNCLTEIK